MSALWKRPTERDVESASPPASPQALEAVMNEATSLGTVVQRWREAPDDPITVTMLERWKRRAAVGLEPFVSPQDLARFRAIPSTPDGARHESFEDVFHTHVDFLATLTQEIQSTPAAYAQVVARERQRADTARRRRTVQTASGVPEHPTLAWLWRTVPASWLWCGAAAAAALFWSAFAAGVRVGANPRAFGVVGPLVGVSSEAPSSAPAATSAAPAPAPPTGPAPAGTSPAGTQPGPADPPSTGSTDAPASQPSRR